MGGGGIVGLLLGVLAAGVALVLTVVGIALRRLTVLPRPPSRPIPSELGIPYEDVSFASPDGVALRGWFFPCQGRSAAIVYCPGRGRGLNAFDFRYAALFHDAGYHVLMFDWRGMGASGGRASMGYWEQEDLRGAVAYLGSRGIRGKIGAFGTSLGAAVVFLAAGALPELTAVAGECAFATYQGMIADGMKISGVPGLIARPLAWMVARAAARWRGFPLSEADPVRAIRRITPRPVFIIHGEADQHVPVAAAYALYEAAGEPKEMWVIPGVAHTKGLEQVGPEYRQRVLAFFGQWLRD